MTRARRLTTTGLATLGVLAGGLLAMSAPALAAPEKPLTEAATLVTSTTATLNGQPDPLAAAMVGYEFHLNNNGSCEGKTVGGVAVTSLAAGTKAETQVTGLEPNQNYMFCIVAFNAASETTTGAALPLKTLPASPKVDSESVSAVTSTVATLEAQVNPNNEKTSAYMQYSSSATVNGSGSLTTATKESSGELGSAGYGDQPVAPDALTGLSAGSTYYYQAVATNATGTEYGEVKEFTTAATPFTDAVNPIGTTTDRKSVV